MKANDKKQKIINKAKRLHYQQAISDATSKSIELWRLAKWGKSKSRAPKEISKMPQLKVAQPRQSDVVADTFEEKIELLKSSFFPLPPEANLSDL